MTSQGGTKTDMLTTAVGFSRFRLAVRRAAGKQKYAGFEFAFGLKVAVCGHCAVFVTEPPLVAVCGHCRDSLLV